MPIGTALPMQKISLSSYGQKQETVAANIHTNSPRTIYTEACK